MTCKELFFHKHKHGLKDIIQTHKKRNNIKQMSDLHVSQILKSVFVHHKIKHILEVIQLLKIYVKNINK